LNEELPPRLSLDGKFPGWAALLGMLVCPLIGLFMVGLTTWTMRSKVLVGIGGSIVWLVALGLMIFTNLGGPTGA
jgi:hypothetical protein